MSRSRRADDVRLAPLICMCLLSTANGQFVSDSPREDAAIGLAPSGWRSSARLAYVEKCDPLCVPSVEVARKWLLIGGHYYLP